jgi:hypothetical protein
MVPHGSQLSGVPSRGAGSSAPTVELSNSLWNPKVHNGGHKSFPRGQINPVHTSTPYLYDSL